MRFIVDAQLPPSLAIWLREAGHEAEHVLDVGLLESDDTIIWQYAVETDSIVITKDEDFVTLARQINNAPRIVWLRVGNVSNTSLRVWFLPRLDRIQELIDQNVRLIELR